MRAATPAVWVRTLPAPRIDDELHERVMEEIIRPTLAGLEEEGMPTLDFFMPAS